MIDLIGYWLAVSVVTLVYLIPVVFVLNMVFHIFMSKVLNSNYEADVFISKYFTFNWNSGVYIKDKEILSDIYLIILSVISILVYMGTLVYATEMAERETLTGNVFIVFTDLFASWAAPASMYILVPLVLFYGSVYVTRKTIAVSKKLASISKKLEES